MTRKKDEKRVFHEQLNDNFGFYYTINETLYRGKTAFQDIELVDTPEFGKVLLLDNITQVAEKNDYQYHEPMVHPALCCHPKPQDILVIGGGDGGILKEVLKYPTVRKIHFAELDSDVVNFSKKYLSSMNKNSFDQPRVRMNFTDGRAFVEKRNKEFDGVIMDMTDPFGPSKMLYTKEFFQAVKRSLKNPRGVFVMHSESPITRPVAFNCINKTLGKVFTHVNIVYIYIQMYAVLWSIAVCSDETDISKTKAAVINRRLETYGITNNKVYTGATHHAMLAAYPYIEDILKTRAPIITDSKPDFPDSHI
ncbi:MAG: polyamine aminopropyltransferase [Chitinivibrionales bacterium]|nr:polyamine aminopropyltransferase [Chitinivibrionales bacterium]